MPRWARHWVKAARGGLVQGDAAFAVQLAQRNPEPVPVRSVVHDAAQLEVEQFADTQPGSAHHDQADSGEQVGQVRHGGQERGVDVRR